MLRESKVYGNLTGIFKKILRDFHEVGATKAVCERSPLLFCPFGHSLHRSKGNPHTDPRGKSYLQSRFFCCLFGWLVLFHHEEEKNIAASIVKSLRLLHGVHTHETHCSGRRVGIYQGSEPVQPHT